MLHNPSAWAYFEELRIGTGMSKDSLQRLDAWCINYYPSHRNVTRCYEVKVSRSDFNKELSDPVKRRAGLRVSNEFYFITPKGLCEVGEIPIECGLMEVDKYGEWETIVPAPFRDVNPPTWLFLSAICRRMDKYRLEEYLEIMKQDQELQMYGKKTIDILSDKIKELRDFNQGNKEIPDKIADTLTGVLHDVEDAVKHETRIKT